MALADLVDQIVERAGSHCQAEYGLLLGSRKARLFQSPAESFGHVSVIARIEGVVTPYWSPAGRLLWPPGRGQKNPPGRRTPEDAGGFDAPGIFSPELGAVGHHPLKTRAGTRTFHGNSNLLFAVS